MSNVNEVVIRTRLNFCRFPARFSIFSKNAPNGCCRNMTFWHLIFKKIHANAIYVLYYHRWNFHTSTGNINMCCIGHLEKVGKRGKIAYLWFLKKDDDVDVQYTVVQWMLMYLAYPTLPFFSKMEFGKMFFYRCASPGSPAFCYFLIFWLIEICFD